MSACYTIELNMKFNSPESMSDAVRSLQEYIKKDAETDYDLESYAADGIGTENIDDLIDISIDNDYNGLVIRNGICKQINLKGEEEKSL